MLAQAEFAYNDSPNRSTGLIPFQILYGMHPTGVYELKNLGYLEHKSVEGEICATTINEIHEQVKQKLQDNNYKYKLRGDVKRREVNFEVGDDVRKENSKQIRIYIMIQYHNYPKLVWRNISLGWMY